MKRFIVIESDSEYNSMWAYEVRREFSGEDDEEKGVAYYRRADANSLMFGLLNPEWYGRLDALLLTKEKIEKAPPITPVPTMDDLAAMQTKVIEADRQVVEAVSLADMDHAGVTDGEAGEYDA